MDRIIGTVFSVFGFQIDGHDERSLVIMRGNQCRIHRVDGGGQWVLGFGGSPWEAAEQGFGIGIATEAGE